MDVCSRSSRDDPLLPADLKSFEFGGWDETWSVPEDVKSLIAMIRDYSRVLGWLGGLVSYFFLFMPDIFSTITRTPLHLNFAASHYALDDPTRKVFDDRSGAATPWLRLDSWQ